MKYLVLSDIHGNNIALEQVLSQVFAEQFQKILVLGDNIGDGPCPDKVLDILSERDVLFIQGNREQLAMEHFDGLPATQTALQWDFMRRSLAFLSSEKKAFIRSFPQQTTVEDAGLSLLMVHGSPFSIRELLYPDKTARLSACLDAIAQNILLCGHNHQQYARILDDKLILNPGSVGLCQTGEAFRADYAILELNHGQYKFALHHTYYDGEAIEKEYRRRGLLEGGVWGNIALREMGEGKMYIIGFARFVMEMAKAYGMSIQPIPDEIWREAVKTWDWQPA